MKGRPRGDARVHVRYLPRARVLRGFFNPEEADLTQLWGAVQSRLARLRSTGRIGRSGVYREIYRGNPWKDPGAWQRVEAQIVVYPRRRTSSRT